MNRKLVFIAMLLIPAILFAGGKKDAGTGAAPAAEKPVTLKVWESTNGPDEFIKSRRSIYRKIS